MCLWCGDLQSHKVNENDSISIDADNNLRCFDRFDRLTSALYIKFCPICGQDLRYRFDAHIKSSIDQIIYNVNCITEQINKASKEGQHVKSAEYMNKRDGILLALKLMGVEYSI